MPKLRTCPTGRTSSLCINSPLPLLGAHLLLVQVTPEEDLRYVKCENLPQGRTSHLAVNSVSPLFGVPFLLSTHRELWWLRILFFQCFHLLIEFRFLL